MKRIAAIMTICMVFSIMSVCYAADEIPKTLKGVTAATPDSPSGRAMYAVWKEVFRRTGVEDFTVEYYPAKRATQMLIHGKADIDIWRVGVYDEILLMDKLIQSRDEIVKIKEHICKGGFYAYALDPEEKINIKSGEDLKGTDYKVEYRAGHAWARVMLPKFVREENLSNINSNEQGLKKLRAKRTDIFVAPKENVDKLLATDEFKNSGIRLVGKIKDTLTCGWMSKNYADKKYDAFLSRVNNVIKEMRESGEINAIMLKEGMISD